MDGDRGPRSLFAGSATRHARTPTTRRVSPSAYCSSLIFPRSPLLLQLCSPRVKSFKLTLSPNCAKMLLRNFLCNSSRSFFLLIIFVVVVSLGHGGFAQTSFTCPVANGFFPDSEQCDAYNSCKESVRERKLCPEGLFYDDRSIHYPRYPCTHPQDVQCGSRTRTRVKRLPRIGRRR